VDIKKHLLLIDTFIIVPEVPGYLYALFDYGLTKEVIRKRDTIKMINIFFIIFNTPLCDFI
ncbi:hypothetical protein ACQKNB_24605, partial [Lysinibacillus xylanilyticus]|uniref:hypothetical protein n=1 Tax=Lysinibacillus xylanilyticus TaxID=582475 RepID=UPI003D065977